MQGEQQKELFEDLIPSQPHKKESLGGFRQEIIIALTWDRAIFAAIGIVVLCAVMFSLGVERGKKIGIDEKILIRSRKNQDYYIGPFKTKTEAQRAIKEIMRR